jgi:hypothetical protein
MLQQPHIDTRRSKRRKSTAQVFLCVGLNLDYRHQWLLRDGLWPLACLDG